MNNATSPASFVMGDSIPALLAEEWMIQPQSPFPSFLEIVLMQQTERAIDDAIPSCFAQVLERLRSFSHQMREEMYQREQGSGTTTLWQRLLLSYYRIMERGTTVAARVTDRHHKLLGTILRYSIERQCLRRTGACLAESVYGTKRAVVAKDRQLLPLTTVDQTRLALLLALGQPYIKSWLGNIVARTIRDGRYRPSYRVALSTTLSALANAWKLGNTYFLLSYLVGHSYHTNVRDFAFGHVLRRVTQEDNVAPSTTNPPQSTVVSPAVVSKLSTIAGAVGLALTTIGWCAQLRSWYEEERCRQRPSTTVIPPPPLSQQPPSCPLCSKLRPIQPTAITITGFVFCNVCIRRYVMQHNACPVTATGPITEKDLVRLYEPTNE